MNKNYPPHTPTPLNVTVINFLRQRVIAAAAQFCKKQPGGQPLVLTLTVPVSLEISINPADLKDLIKAAA